MIKILHVEDNPANRVLVRQVLEMAGYTVVDAPDGLSGLNLAQQEQPDLILMDINIPGMDGYETTTRLKSFPSLEHVPIIALTAKVLDGDRERALTAGCDGYIAKPINVDTLPAQIAEFLGGHREEVPVEQQQFFLKEYNERLVDRLEQKVKELTNANQDLSHTDVMKSRFINMAAHELRTPLTTIQGYLTILTASGNTFFSNADDNTRELVDGIVTGVDRLHGIVQDMLDVTRIEAGTLQLKPTLVNVSLLLSRIERDFMAAIVHRKQTLIISPAKNVPNIWADGERIIQILRNLVSNAIKYTPDGGTIAISTTIMGGDTAQSEPYLKFTIKDTGIGIPPQQQEKIFENFYEARDLEHHSTSKIDFMGSGAGLGLPIARGVAEAHGGSLWAESPGYDPESCPGTAFHLIIPFGKLPQE
jgi:signal transduction histidine kinase